MVGKKNVIHVKLMAGKSAAKTPDELSLEEYLKQAELAIENH
jgi:hypothetical protein